jgi:uncharacterized lipoprotein YmbA
MTSNRRTRSIRIRDWLVVWAMAVTACGASPPVRFYDLTTEMPEPPAKATKRLVGLGPFVMPDYLKRPQIVVRGPANELTLAEFHRWVEPPDRAFTRWLSGEVDQRLSALMAVAYPYAGVGSVDLRVRGVVQRWDTDAAGEAVLVVQWGILDAQDQALVPWRTASYSAHAVNADRYDARVTAMQSTLVQFANEITAALEGVPPHKP